MKKTVLLLLIIVSLLLVSCSKKSEEGSAASGVKPLEHGSSMDALAPPSDPEIISELAVKALMDTEEYSSVRECPVEYVMVHFCSEVVNDKNDPFNAENIKKTFEKNSVSINYIILRDGTIRCWIPEQRVAWHAGKGVWNGDEKYTDKMNKYSIGIELTAIGSKSDMKQYVSSSYYNSIPKSFIGFTDEQYESLVALLGDICQRWSIPLDRDHIIGHSEYSSLKTDPGELFDWERVISELQNSNKR
ncbi:MAG: N-acetylmuramoyl-L-alanine amidase [Clostridia bacterium]|nr:N-acetylmuramoyl-L-alanine amidase [Clostridia bacterium]